VRIPRILWNVEEQMFVEAESGIELMSYELERRYNELAQKVEELTHEEY
jgi:hypothetical protein